MEYEVLAGAHLGAKREMAQSLPLILQLMNNPTFVANINDGGFMFDGRAIFKAFIDASGWKFQSGLYAGHDTRREATARSE